MCSKKKTMDLLARWRDAWLPMAACQSMFKAVSYALMAIVALCSCVRDSDSTPNQAPRQYCVELRAALEDVASGKSAWRCTAFHLDLAAADSTGVDEDACARWIEVPCVGAFPADGKFACGPRDCSKGMACLASSGCDLRQNFSCSEFTSPCSEQNCGCALEVCTTMLSGCATGADGDLWVQCTLSTECD